jgi:signal transduction histidine kinase
VVFNKIFWVQFIFLWLTSITYGQNFEEYVPSDIDDLKKQFYKAKDVETQVQLAMELSSAYYSFYEIDSAKSYASTAINLLKTTKETSPNYKSLLAKAIDSYGLAISFTNPAKAIDTLKVALNLCKEVGSKDNLALAYYSLGEAYSRSSNKIEAIDYYEKSLDAFRELNNRRKEGVLLYEISLEKRYLGLYGDALEYSLKSLKVAEEIQDTAMITNALLGNSFNYLLTKNYADALREQQKALRFYELSKDSIGIATTYNDMGVTYYFQDNMDKALAYHKMALDIRKKVDFSSIGISYNYIAEVYREQGKLKEALKYINEGLQYTTKYSDNRFVLDDYLVAGDIYLELKEYDQAIKNYNSVIEIAKKDNNPVYQARGLFRIGAIHQEAGNLYKALEYLKQADTFMPLEDFERRQSIYRKTMEIYEALKDYKNAFRYQAKFQEMSDSVSAAVKAEKIATLTQELMYENKRAIQKASQDKELALKESQIKTQKLIKNISIVGLVLILVFAVIFYIRFKEKRKLSQSLEKTLTELKGTQQQLIQSEKMASLGELTAGIAHEIQNPLNFVNNFSEVSQELIDEMKEELNANNKQEAIAIAEDLKLNLEKINHHGKRADSIVKGMLQHSRSNSGEKETVDINKLTDEYVRLAYHGLRAKNKDFNAHLETHFDEALPEMQLVPQDIGRVILNLITNAFHAVDEKNKNLKDDKTISYAPTVNISTHKNKDELLITVTDNGNGIPKKVIKKIFEPFFTTKPTGQGTGLGLSMSYEIIKAHGGNITVDTKNGEYTTFKISLPLINPSK